MARRQLSSAERRAWAKVAQSIKPLPGKPAPDAPADESDGRGTPMRSRGRALSVSQEADGHQSSKPRSPPADRSGERKVRRGQWSIDGTLDLHGHTQASADSALRAFLHFHSAMGARCVLVITGKGRQGEGILRRRFLDWLETHEARALSSGYAPAHRKHGGGGAWYVFLRRPATQR